MKNIILWAVFGIAEGLWLNEVHTTGTKIFWHFSAYHFALLLAFLVSGYENKGKLKETTLTPFKWLCLYILVQDAASHLIQGGFFDWSKEGGFFILPWYYYFLGLVQYLAYKKL